ncbi:hypothetical protein BC829DRAFT_383919 [Chytridium lagenaria]|nr:hypothetical protein BC829DRAFT_383919 [Chytridium lagenaria]
MYLKKRFGTQDVIAEWGYNLHAASQRHSFQSVQCKLFYEILTENLDESVYHHQQAMIERLRGAFLKFDSVKHDGKARGLITKKEAGKILEEFWGWKTPEQIGLLISVVREQDMEFRDKYITDLTVQHVPPIRFEPLQKDPRVSATDILRSLVALDPQKPRRDLDAYVARGFNIPAEQIKPRSMVMVEVFMKALGRGLERGPSGYVEEPK